MRKYLLIFVLTLFTTLSFSQRSQYTTYGIRAGINITNLDFDPGPLFDNQHRNGFYFGGFAEFPFSDTVFLNTELQWSAEGAKDENLRANYLNVPIQVRLAIGDNITVGAGPQVSLKTWKTADGFSTWNFAGVGGVEYRIFDDYFVDLRASYRFSDVLDDTFGAGLEAKQFLIQLGVGIKM
ncbi:MAG: PorT family protein [Winogradskyella sp.]|uniref:porin family protein n=1 Tax=Winogradskyella sp. TaxID=1883156 RepID=UPI000F3ED7CA|nr:porin family protein [Winogradskyella sp.]RNC87167.1 MAG: PorT family protein [Winogradskyella sp.]